MVNWNDPATLAREVIIFGNVIHFVSGLYAWETAINFISFDWSVISGKRHFRWPMLLYFACRYLMLFALVGVLVALNTTQEVNCQALYTFNQFAGNSAIGLASSLLMLRTIAVWNRNLWVTIPLVVVSLGQWAILLHGMTTVVSSWNPQANACVVVESGTTFLDLIYFYTMSFDLIVLILTSLGLFLSPGRSSLWKLLFTDGMIFFALASVSNSVPAVFIAINLNPVMNIMFSVPAACIAAIFACRSFIRVATYSTGDKYAHSSGPSDRVSTRIGSAPTKNSKGIRAARHPTDTFDSAYDGAGLPYHSTATATAGGVGTSPPGGGVHVLMETFSQSTDDKPQDDMYSEPPPLQQASWRDDKHGHSFGPDV